MGELCAAAAFVTKSQARFELAGVHWKGLSFCSLSWESIGAPGRKTRRQRQTHWPVRSRHGLLF